MREGNFSREDVGTYEMQAAIMQAQLRAEEDVMRNWNEECPEGGTEGDFNLKLLSDRSAVDPIVYASLADGSAAFQMSRRLLENPALQQILPVYRQHSLFGMSTTCTSLALKQPPYIILICRINR